MKTVELVMLLSRINKLLFIFFLLLFALPANSQIVQFSGAPTGSTVGLNLGQVTYFSNEQPFIDLMKLAEGWAGRGGDGVTNKVALDANWWVTSLVETSGGQTYTQIDTSVNVNLSQAGDGQYYRSGQYLMLYDGTGTVSYGNDATKNVGLSTPGRDVLDVVATTNGIKIVITATNAAPNNVRNMRLLLASNEAALNSGEIFNPDFVARVTPFKAFRFMDWMQTNGSTDGTDFSARTTTSQAFWAATDGSTGLSPTLTTRAVPIEVMVALCNKFGADCWFNMPALATDSYVTSFATLVKSLITSSTSKIYVEDSNEVWNFATQQNQEGAAGLAFWGTISGFTYPFSYAWNWHIKRTNEIADIWATVWGADFSRIKPVFATQIANLGLTTYLLTYDQAGNSGNLYCHSHPTLPLPATCATPMSPNLKAVAGAPYFGYCGNPAWTLNDLFQEMFTGGASPSSSCSVAGGMLAQAAGWITAIYAVTNPAGLELVAYEGGQTLYAAGDATLNTLYTAANNDPRMGTATLSNLNSWKNTTTGKFFYFNDVQGWGLSGYWGSLQNVLDTSGAKYDAIRSFR